MISQASLSIIFIIKLSKAYGSGTVNVCGNVVAEVTKTQVTPELSQ